MTDKDYTAQMDLRAFRETVETMVSVSDMMDEDDANFTLDVDQYIRQTDKKILDLEEEIKQLKARKLGVATPNGSPRESLLPCSHLI